MMKIQAIYNPVVKLVKMRMLFTLLMLPAMTSAQQLEAYVMACHAEKNAGLTYNLDNNSEITKGEKAHFTRKEVIIISPDSQPDHIKVTPYLNARKISIKLDVKKVQIVEITLTDSDNAIVYRRNLFLTAGVDIQTMSLRSYPAGRYDLRVVVNSEEVRFGITL